MSKRSTPPRLNLSTHLPNMISLSRILCSLSLVPLRNNQWAFFTLYIIAGVSDCIDGFIARKHRSTSQLGARLDSIADLTLFGAGSIYVVPWLITSGASYLVWIAAVGIVRVFNLFIVFVKFRTFAILHTWANKITGLLLFLTPLFVFLELHLLLWVVCYIALFSAIEETLIHLASRQLDVDRASLFCRLFRPYTE